VNVQKVNIHDDIFWMGGTWLKKLVLRDFLSLFIAVSHLMAINCSILYLLLLFL